MINNKVYKKHLSQIIGRENDQPLNRNLSF